MKKIYAKVGTHSSGIIYVGFKRNLPNVGDKIKFRRDIDSRKWEQGMVDDIRLICGEALFFIALI